MAGPASIYLGHCVLEGYFNSDTQGQKNPQGSVLEPHTSGSSVIQEDKEYSWGPPRQWIHPPLGFFRLFSSL